MLSSYLIKEIILSFYGFYLAAVVMSHLTILSSDGFIIVLIKDYIL